MASTQAEYDAFETARRNPNYSQAVQIIKARMPATVQDYAPADWIVEAVLDALRPAKPATKRYEFRTFAWYHEGTPGEHFDQVLARLCVDGWRFVSKDDSIVTLEREVNA